MEWAVYQIGYTSEGGFDVYCPLEVAIQCAKRDDLPFVKDLSNGDVIVWEK